MSSEKLGKTKRNKHFFWKTNLIATLLIVVALIIPIKTYSPVLKAEISYQLNKNKSEFQETKPVDNNFSIIIPKINANAKVVRNVNPYEPKEYQKALTQGVAHASGTATPNQKGNVFIFAHSATNWYQANQYNAVFYLLNKLEKGDTITLYFENIPYNYFVDEIKFIKPTEVDYLSNKQNNSTLTLMTCWPPGTTLKRLVVVAKKI